MVKNHLFCGVVGLVVASFCSGCASYLKEAAGFASQRNSWSYTAEEAKAETIGPQAAYTEIFEGEGSISLLADGSPDYENSTFTSIRSLVVNPSAEQSTRLGLGAIEGQNTRELQYLNAVLQGASLLGATFGRMNPQQPPVPESPLPPPQPALPEPAPRGVGETFPAAELIEKLDAILSRLPEVPPASPVAQPALPDPSPPDPTPPETPEIVENSEAIEAGDG